MPVWPLRKGPGHRPEGCVPIDHSEQSENPHSCSLTVESFTQKVGPEEARQLKALQKTVYASLRLTAVKHRVSENRIWSKMHAFGERITDEDDAVSLVNLKRGSLPLGGLDAAGHVRADRDGKSQERDSVGPQRGRLAASGCRGKHRWFSDGPTVVRQNFRSPVQRSLRQASYYAVLRRSTNGTSSRTIRMNHGGL